MIVENLPCPFDRRVWQQACALQDAGYRVTIICPRGKGHESPEETIRGIRILRHPLPVEASGALGYVLEYGSALLWEAWLTVRVAFREGFDVIHGCNPPDTIFLIGAAARIFGKRYIFDQHDINPELFEAKFGKRGLLYRFVRLLERLSFATARVVISTNESYRRIALDRGGKRENQVFIVRNGPDLGRIRPVSPNPGLRNGRKHLVGYVGVMGQQEGIDYLLRSVAHIVRERRREDIQFCLVGGGTELEAMREYARKLGISEYVTFLGRVPDQLLLEALSTADLCVNPDPVNEMNDKSTMNKVMEYMALGKSIVQFELTEGRFSAREASLYAAPNDERDFADKIIELLDDPERMARMGEAGRTRINDVLAWHHQVPNLLAAYEAAFARPGR
jgi:glycosyltransferase involved in cell wall biosynthesis